MMKQSASLRVNQKVRLMKHHARMTHQLLPVVHVNASVVVMLALLITLWKYIIQKGASRTIATVKGVVTRSLIRERFKVVGTKLFPWISVCTSKYRVYCATCQAANDQGLLNPKPAKSAFIHDGFTNWKKVLEKFREHEGSKMHKEATQKLAEKTKGVGIDAQLNAQLRDDQKHHSSMFMKLLHAIQFLFTSRIVFSWPQRGYSIL